MNDAEFIQLIRRQVAEYELAFPAEGGRLVELKAQIERPEAIRSRKTSPGHVTAAALILDPTRTQMLLIYNRKLSGWMQPGGHFDPLERPHEAALREALEETALPDLALDAWHGVEPAPIDLDSHRIPASEAKGEPAHWHHDFRFVIASPGGTVRPDASEISAWEWRAVREIASPESPAPDLIRVAVKLLSLGIAR